MRRLLVLAVLLVLVPALSAANPPTLAARLASRVDFNGFEADPKMTFQEALDILASHYDLPFDVNDAAFKAEGVEDVRSVPVVERVLPKMTNVRLDTVLRKLLARVPNPSGATYIVRPDGIEITTGARLREEVWGAEYRGPFLPLASATFDRRPLDEALRELAELDDFTILVDGRAAEKARTPVTARLSNVPLDTAVRLLADMADLKAFLVDDVLYVTTRENADALAKQERRRIKAADEPHPRQGSRYGPGSAPAGGM